MKIVTFGHRDPIHLKRNRGLIISTSSAWILLTLSLISFCILVFSPGLTAKEYFDPSALEMIADDQPVPDLTNFSTGNGQLPGTYMVDIYLNGNKVDTRNIKFFRLQDSLLPELTVGQLTALGVKTEALASLQNLPADKTLSDLGQYIPDANSQLNFAEQRLDLSIPQAALNNEARGYVDPILWDRGVNAFLMNYSFSGANTWEDGRAGTSDSNYLNLRSGLNWGDWRLRNYSTYYDNNGQTSLDNVNTYLQHDITPLKGQLTLGDSVTPSDVFDSVQYRGIQLNSDDNMYPDSLRGFAPVVRGIARSNAQVTVRQNGYIIYQSYVPPGAFAISDLYPTSASGDLEVTITETDGSERSLTQPFSAVPVMLREGRLKYALTAGEYRTANSDALTPYFGQGTMIYGLPFDSTAYGGVLIAKNYNSQVFGLGHGFGLWGSLSIDATQAKAELDNGETRSGQSYRFQYAKDIEVTSTTFTLAGYRYSTNGFYDFQETNDIGSFGKNDMWRNNYIKRSKAQISINQSLGAYGNVYVNAFQQDYWRRGGVERNISIGYSVSKNSITYGLNYTLSQSPERNSKDQQLALNIQIPLDNLLPNSWASYNISASKNSGTSQQIGLGGTALADNNLNYNISQGYADKGVGGSGNASASYLGTYAEAQVGYSYTSTSERLNYGAQGGIVAHSDGVTFSQQHGETIALVEALGAAGAKIQNNTGVRTDWRGYAVVPYLSTYRQNRIALDTESLGDDIDLETATQTVIPTRGAVVLAKFQTRIGSRVLLTLNYKNKPVPFGATVALQPNSEASDNVGIVGTNGQVYLSGVADRGLLYVKWGSHDHNRCEANFELPKAESISSIQVIAVDCK
ncbi:fimbria/pilus outer membrane usher protein [Pseudomonas sp. Irchel s3a12]|uniref:fimbria/pilus outer membrane usher protein n=1 Tax=Pseudomonas sp. Irchel s3a12 TaxID=2009047 RepID=UPI000BA3FE0A|nr:fimbria/pilus outer membrane usher protein [Pseudomonas sp. Irchel s3a12]